VLPRSVLGPPVALAQAPAQGLPPPPAAPVEPPIHSQSFTNYQLLGSPNPQANLLGTVRPRDWHTTKSELQSALRATAQADDPIQDWLNTFQSSFDDHATDVVIKAAGNLYQAGSPALLKYEPQLYDVLLRSAAALLDRCLRYRTDMGRYEISGISAGISYLSFLKLKPLQRNFIVQSNQADLAAIEKTTSQNASQKLTGSFVWADAARQIELGGDVKQAGISEQKDQFLTGVLENQFDIQSDAQLALFTRLLETGSASNYAERYLRLLSLLTEDLGDAYCKLFSASKGVQQVLNINQVTVALNSPINVDIPILNSATAISSWIAQIVPGQGSQRKPDILDALVLWSRAVMRTLDAAAQYESEFTVSIPLNQPWDGTNSTYVTPTQMANAFTAPNPSGTVPFTLPNNALPISATQKNIRVIGIGLSVEHSPDDQSPLQFTSSFPHTPSNPVVAVGQTPAASQEPTPAQVTAAQAFELPKVARLNATITTPQQSAVGGGTYSRPKVFLPNVRIQGGSGGDLDPLLSYDATCRGLSPFGAWTISFDPNALAFYQSSTAITTNFISGLVLHLRLRGSLS
jgi:hypothetical protein